MRITPRRLVRTPRVLTAALLLLAPALLHSQVPDLPAGARVRLMIADSMRVAPLVPRMTPLIGRVERVTGDTFYVVPQGASTPAAIPRRVVRQAAVSLGNSRARSAFTHAVGTAIALAIFGYLAEDDGDRSWERVGSYAAVGAGAGLLIGALSPYEHWRRLR